MDITMIVLRLFHIFAGVFWVGAGLMAIAVLVPFTQFAGEEGKRFGQRFMSQSKYGMFMGIASMLTVLSGALMYWRVSNGFRLTWLTSPTGIVLTIGALAGILALVLGMTVHSPTGARLAALGKEIAAAGGAQTPAQAQTLGQLQARIAKANRWSAVLLITATIGMAIARYV